MRKLKFITSLSSVFLFLFVWAEVVLAQAGLNYPLKPSGIPGQSSDRAQDLILYVINIALAVAGIIAVAFLIWGGFRYLTSAGNEEAAESAKKTIRNSIIGLIVIILSYVIIVVIINAIARNAP